MCSNVFKWVQNLFKCVQMYSNVFKLFRCVWTFSNVFELFSKLVQMCSIVFKCVQPCWNLFKTCSNEFKCFKCASVCPNLFKCVKTCFKLVQKCSNLIKKNSNVFHNTIIGKIITLCSARGPTWRAELDLVKKMFDWDTLVYMWWGSREKSMTTSEYKHTPI